MFPSFSREKLYVHAEIHPDDNLELPPSPRTGGSYTVSPSDHENSEEASDETSRPGILRHGEHTEDDTAVSSRPSRQVDYLSHDWREEDIWSSWRYIVTRRGEFSNSARLENASWRSWIKAKNNLKTISPESLNWLKDCDVTWLYGPLQSGLKDLHSTQSGPSSVSLSKTDSPANLNKKPILKRSMSEVMPQRPLSTASLLKQTTAAVEAHETRGILRPHLGCLATGYLAYPLSQRRLCGECSNAAPSTGPSGIASPNSKRKHIHFNEQVEQCIAVEVKGDDDDDDMGIDRYGDDSDLDDGAMMKRTKPKKRQLYRRKTLKSKAAEGMTIAMLPSTTLKYREDTPEPRETAMKHSRSPTVSPSSSQEILRPAKQPSELFFGEEEDDYTLDDALLGPSSGWSSPPAEGANGSLHRSTSSVSLCEAPTGMRRTPSGMFMPYEAGEASSTDGIFGHVMDTANTARDIAHVFWNVGWWK
ncbi:protein phosphatase regulator [Fusarium falciforme]|nr:protein phosphatase regulator [Fusarium falciforme]KAJ4217441.1 protein phosphatase regulator [Fusarium falciforme]